jgi:hypothetical protein
MLTDTVTVAPHQADNEYGVPTFGPGVDLPARVVRKRKQVLTAAGEQAVSESIAYVAPGSVVIEERDRVTLPDGRQPEILSLEDFKDDDGEHVVTIYFRG